MRRVILAFCATLCVLASPALAQKIIAVTPSGDAGAISEQITIQYDKAMTGLGERAIDPKNPPAVITPALNCQWRWLNEDTATCNLNEADRPKPATTYTVKASGAEYTFTTTRPTSTYVSFGYWLSPVMPTYDAQFSMKITRESVAAHLYFETEKGQRVAVHVRDEDDSYQMREELAKRQPVERKSDPAVRDKWLIEPATALPAGTQYTLKEEAGLQTPEGTAQGNTAKDITTGYTFAAPALLGVSCVALDGQSALIAADSKQSAAELCDPMANFALVFSTPVSTDDLKKSVQFVPDLVGGNKDIDPWENYGVTADWALGQERDVSDKTYRVGFPSLLKAVAEYSVVTEKSKQGWFARAVSRVKEWFGVTDPTILRDVFGQAVQLPAKITFKTDHRSPNVVVPYTEAVLEKNVDTDFGIYVNNLNSYELDYSGVNASGAFANKTSVALPKVVDKQYLTPLNIRQLLGNKTGILWGNLQTTPRIEGYAGDRLITTIITPYDVQVKLGHFSSVAYVVDLATGKPVPDAKVSVYVQDKRDAFDDKGAAIASAQTDKDGIASLPGAAVLDPELEARDWNREKPYLMVRVDKDGDVAFAPLTGDFKISSWRSNDTFGVSETLHRQYGHLLAWGTTAQGVYRPGDTIEYKITVRNQDSYHLTPAPKAGYTLTITDAMGNDVDTIDGITLSPFGGYSGTYEVPENASVGWYNFKLDYKKADGADADDAGSETENRIRMEPLRVLVTDFTPSPFGVQTTLAGNNFTAGDSVAVDVKASMHAGGPYASAPARITAVVNPTTFTLADPKMDQFGFDSFSEESNNDVYQETKTVDADGVWKQSFTLGTYNVAYGALTVEGAVQDDRGKMVANTAIAHYSGVDRLVGIRTTAWDYPAGKPLSMDIGVADPKTRALVGGTPVSVAITRQETVAAKTKSAGNAYLTDYQTTDVPFAKCDVQSAVAPVLCSFTPDKAGLYTATATIKDTKGHEHKTSRLLWVTGSDYVLWNEASDAILEMESEKPTYKIGEVAHFRFKNPFPHATGIVTVERYGVLDKWVQTFDTSTGVIDVPVKADYLPGFYVSVMLTSPRVDKPLGEGQIDLGKPAMRMGYIKIAITDPAKELTVTAKADKEEYRPRDQVKLDLHAAPRPGMETKEPIELAVAVVDESVFDLIAAGRDAYDPYKGFYYLDDLDVSTYSLISRLVGRQKFEKKGANPGGDGGLDLSFRDIDKYVSYWNPSVMTDGNGSASVSFTAPDNLTGWRVLVMAMTPTDRMGLGEGTFKVNRPTEIRPALPNQVSEGDAFDATFTVMNRTDKPRTLMVDITAQGGPVAKDPMQGGIAGALNAAYTQEKVDLKPYERKSVTLPIKTRLLTDADVPYIDFSVSAKDAFDGDGFDTKLPVLKRRSVLTSASYISSTDAKVTQSVEVPAGIIPDASQLKLTVSPSLLSGLSGAFKYMRDYPYMCWEQRLTKAVSAMQFMALKPYLGDSIEWTEANEKFVQQTIDDANLFQAPNGGMGYFEASNDRVDPYLTAYTALAFGWLQDKGYTVPDDVLQGLDDYMQDYLKNEVQTGTYNQEMTGAVRAVMLSALAKDGKASVADVTRLGDAVPHIGLMGQTALLDAAMSVKAPLEFKNKLYAALMAKSSRTGGELNFNETQRDDWQTMLSTPLRENCKALSTLTRLSADADFTARVGNAPQNLVRSIIAARKNRDHFENTQENLFCMQGLIDYAARYESEPVDAKITASLPQTKPWSASFADVKEGAQAFAVPLTESMAGKTLPFTIDKQGSGRLYYQTLLQYAKRDASADLVNSGFDVRREYYVRDGKKWTMLKSGDKLQRGALVRVDLFVHVPTARYFVAVDDPVPGGVEPLNSELATTSKVDDANATDLFGTNSYYFAFKEWIGYNENSWSFYHKELRHDAVRYFADYLPEGSYRLSYTAQVIGNGDFNVPPTKVEEMYHPDVFGYAQGMRLNVGK